MKKRQAYEIKEEIEAKWKARCGCMISSWSVSHLGWLIERWRFFRPQDDSTRRAVETIVEETILQRQRAGLPQHWIYMQNLQVREMMIGAGLDVRERFRKSSVVDDRVIEILPRAVVGAMP